LSPRRCNRPLAQSAARDRGYDDDPATPVARAVAGGRLDGREDPVEVDGCHTPHVEGSTRSSLPVSVPGPGPEEIPAFANTVWSPPGRCGRNGTIYRGRVRDVRNASPDGRSAASSVAVAASSFSVSLSTMVTCAPRASPSAMAVPSRLRPRLPRPGPANVEVPSSASPGQGD
jgi:hypothetical protein